MPRSAKRSMISARWSGSAHRRAQFGGDRAERADLLGRVVGVADDAELLAVRVEFVDQVGGDLDLSAVEVELPAFSRSAARR